MKRIVLCLFCIISLEAVVAQSAPEGLFIQSKAADFHLNDQHGVEIHLKDLIKKGKVIVMFYRGQWSPECMKELKRFQDSLSMIQDKKAILIAVTPETPENIATTIEKTGVQFSVLHDQDLKIEKAYDVAFEVPENTVTRYRNTGIDLEKANGNNGKFLPVPAVYIIDKESTVSYRFFEPDYKKRPTVAEILKNL